MKVFKALGLAMALVATLFVVGNTPANASGGSWNCSNTAGAGSMSFSPGLLLKTGAPQQISGSSGAMTCTGSVAAGTLAFKVASPTVRCSGFIGAESTGTATATWSDPAGMGKSTMKIGFKAKSTVGNTTSGIIFGSVTTTGSNLASGKKIVGTWSINKGMLAKNLGGDCTVTIPITSSALTMAFHTEAA